MTPLRMSLLIFLVVGVTRPIASQGSLTPPGAPAPTMKTLAQIEARTPLPAPGFNSTTGFPITISTPGSYYLTATLQRPASGTPGAVLAGGIVISASHVTLDLGGFSVAGPVLSGSQTSGLGIYITTGTMNVVVRNGVVRDWGRRGIDASQSLGCRFEDLQFTNNGRNGSADQGHGLHLGSGGTARDCHASDNLGDGFRADVSASVFQSTSRDNTGNGFNLTGGILSECLATENTLHGFSAGRGVNIQRCTATANLLNGFLLSRSIAADCMAFDNQGVGIEANSGSLVRQCVSRENDSFGISLTEDGGGGSTVVGNVSSFNQGIGIFVRRGQFGNVVSENNLYANGVAGLRTIPNPNTTVSSGNLIVRNNARANGSTGTVADEFEVDIDDAFGGELSATGGSVFVTDRPWVNFISSSTGP